MHPFQSVPLGCAVLGGLVGSAALYFLGPLVALPVVVLFAIGVAKAAEHKLAQLSIKLHFTEVSQELDVAIESLNDDNTIRARNSLNYLRGIIEEEQADV